ncbi:hypothetical protein [Methanotorris igneus]|uniref:Uncharacterized protein n=1 Tax=Methanotorris igneus (strain DSM 5666 / JCM 11834 / Kol 5) TaxID=880724 RepID=F6BC27_METIK|nr:hypothetical protein [Methanotorris igneus]AEF96108.1 hypothetical protein Metig_0554 [Methanotorris igneus Kol 5]
MTSSKILGDILYKFPYYINEYYPLTKNILSDNIWVIRARGAWILRIINYRQYYIPREDLIKIFEYSHDWYPDVVIEYLLLYANILKRSYGELIKDEVFKNFMLSSIIAAYLLNDNKVVKSLAKYLIKKFPEMEYVTNYFENDVLGKLEILERLMKNPAFREPAFIKIKLWLSEEIKANNEETVEHILKFIRDKYFAPISFVVYELIKLYDGYEIAKEVVDEILSNHPEFIEYYFEYLCIWIDKYPIPIKRKILKEILSYVNFGIELSNKMLNKLKNMVIYERDKVSLNTIMEILNIAGDEEGKLLVKERKSSYKNKYEMVIKNIIKNKNIDEIKEILSDNTIIPKVILFDHFIKLIESKNQEFIEFFGEYSNIIFEQICSLIDKNHHIVLEKIKKFMTILIISNPNLFKLWIINHHHKIQEKCINFLKNLLKELYTGAKIGLLDILEDALDRGYFELVYNFLPEILKLLSHNMWEIKYRALKLIMALNIKKGDVDDVVLDILKSFENTDEDFKLYLLRALRDLPTSKKHKEKVIDLLKGLEIPNEYIKTIIKEIYEEYSKNNKHNFKNEL